MNSNIKKLASIINGKKGGRPSAESISDDKKIFDIYGINLVILTENQYETLIERYGCSVIKCALLILNSWLETSPKGIKHKGKNNYALFRSDGWLINMAKKLQDT